MDLLKEYVIQVVSYQPAASREDMFAEIYDEVIEEYTDKKIANSNLSEAEFLDTYKVHPMKYAAQLATESSSYLIGPQLYFSFISALKIGVVITIIIFLVMAAISAMHSENVWSRFFSVFLSIPEALLWVGAWILSIFIILEKSGQKASWLDNWKASDLSSTDSYQKISRGETLFDFSITTIALLWIFDFIKIPVVVDENNVVLSDWVVLLPDWFWIVLIAMLIFDLGFCIVRLYRQLWTQRLRLITVVTNIAWLAMLGLVVSQAQIIDAAVYESSVSVDLISSINLVLKGIVAGAMLIIGWDTVHHIIQLRKQTNN